MTDIHMDVTSVNVTYHNNYDGWEWHLVYRVGRSSYSMTMHCTGVAPSYEAAAEAAYKALKS